LSEFKKYGWNGCKLYFTYRRVYAVTELKESPMQDYIWRQMPVPGAMVRRWPFTIQDEQGPVPGARGMDTV
jgi:hypothetical protein